MDFSSQFIICEADLGKCSPQLFQTPSPIRGGGSQGLENVTGGIPGGIPSGGMIFYLVESPSPQTQPAQRQQLICSPSFESIAPVQVPVNNCFEFNSGLAGFNQVIQVNNYPGGLVNEDVKVMGEEFTPDTFVSSSPEDNNVNLKDLKYNTCNYEYYVPPMVEDGDYFGGQRPIWQLNMVNYFSKYSPHVWVMKGVEEIKNLYRTYWHLFTITAKLRFCCRLCKRPWTSMRGRMVFCFNLDKLNNRGYIFVKIFGQKCVQEACPDESFQVPACYQEEIQRVMLKVSEYIGYLFYSIPLSLEFFTEPDKAYRCGNPATPHRKEFCQACVSGFCSIKK